MKTNTSVPNSQRTGENRIIRRDTECLLARGGMSRMSEAEADRHLLVMMLGLTRAQLATAQQDLTAALSRPAS